METKIKASNIKCGGCVNTITTELIKIQGIKAVSVDIPTNEITIEFEGAIDMQAIRAKLQAIGYPEKQELIK